MVANSTPDLMTYLEIFQGILETWDNCVPWAQPLWAGVFMFYICIIMAVFYIYILVIIIVKTKRQKSFRSPFHRCIIVLAIGDIITIITSSKEGAVQSCVLASDAVKHLAWESIGAFSIDLIISINLVIAIIRLATLSTLSQGNRHRKNFVLLDSLLVFSIIWSIAMGVLHHYGIVKQVWYPIKDEYHDEMFFPFNYLRTPLQFAELGLTFIIYVIAIVKLQQMKKAVNTKDLRKEARFLILALLIFASEIMYVYSANWIGNNYFHWGSGEFNANLNYTVRPITTGITPASLLVNLITDSALLYYFFIRNSRCLLLLHLQKKNFWSYLDESFQHSRYSSKMKKLQCEEEMNLF